MNVPETECNADCPRKRSVFHLLVFAQFALVAILLLVSYHVNRGWPALLTASSGIAFGMWAIITMGRFTNISPTLKADAPLQTQGPYRFVRHPMYLALIILCGAFLIDDFTAYNIALWLCLLFVLACKIYYEEQILRGRFSHYAAYSKQTKRIIPFIF